MNVVPSKRAKTSERSTFGSKAPTSKFPFRLNFYTSLPSDELTLSQFETCALDRLKVLKAIENAAVRNKSIEDTNAIIKAASEKYLPLDANVLRASLGTEALDAQRQKDHQSHFILRLAFCRTEDNRAWLLKHETMLFKYRYETEYMADRAEFLKMQHLDSSAITKAERDAIIGDLNALFPGNTDQKFYKVPFEQVLGLVSRRAVIIRNGFAYVPESEQATLVTNAFKSTLSHTLESFSRALPRMDEDDRLIPILNSIARQCAMRDYGLATEGNGTTLTANDIDNLVPQGHFPLCMSNLHTHLKADAHLKHSGRLQFGLFLKGTGLPLEEALVYWRKAFHKLTDDKFQKEYAYNIRFNYGQEGSRKDYAPYSCSKIITSNHPAAGDHHGCPFRHANPDTLKSMVVKAGAGEAAAIDIMRMTKEGHYQIACTKLFEVTRAPAIAAAKAAAAKNAASTTATSTDSSSSQEDRSQSLLVTNEGIVDIIEHPNQWFDLSYRGSDSGKHRGMRRQNEEGGSGSGGAMDVDR
ncbi:UNVERIFIED_CONTAM: hypothetical protein HDU68_011728 [Siphonaria sp. JEL0065]|nr:hypothetical protein HDU68_011728 [Siphonaria sp. JEL0065]